MDAGILKALTDSFDLMKTDVISVITVALPAALAIVAIFFVVKKGISFFKSVAK